MLEWINVAHRLFLTVFGRETPGESGALVGFCLLLGALALSRTATALGALKAFYNTCLVLMAAGLALLLAIMALTISLGTDPVWAPVAAAGGALLLILVTLSRFMLKCGYVKALVSWTVALLTVGAILSLEPLAMEKFKRWDRSMQIKNHQIEMEFRK